MRNRKECLIWNQSDIHKAGICPVDADITEIIKWPAVHGSIIKCHRLTIGQPVCLAEIDSWTMTENSRLAWHMSLGKPGETCIHRNRDYAKEQSSRIWIKSSAEREVIVHEQHESKAIAKIYRRCQSCAGRCNSFPRHPSKQHRGPGILQHLQRTTRTGCQGIYQVLWTLESIQRNL